MSKLFLRSPCRSAPFSAATERPRRIADRPEIGSFVSAIQHDDSMKEARAPQENQIPNEIRIWVVRYAKRDENFVLIASRSRDIKG